MLASGIPLEAAADRIGLHPRTAYRITAIPAVSRAIQAEVARLIIQEGAPLAYKVARKLIADEKTGDRVRADLAIKMLQLAGVGQKHADQATDKPLNEMTTAELRATMDRNNAEIERLESELAARATDVTASVSAPTDAPSDPKSLSFLDD